MKTPDIQAGFVTKPLQSTFISIEDVKIIIETSFSVIDIVRTGLYEPIDIDKIYSYSQYKTLCNIEQFKKIFIDVQYNTMYDIEQYKNIFIEYFYQLLPKQSIGPQPKGLVDPYYNYMQYNLNNKIYHMGNLFHD